MPLSTDDTYAPCAECGNPIVATDDRCVHCDYCPVSELYAGPLACLALGCVLTLPLVTAVVGLPLLLVGALWFALATRREQGLTPVDEAFLERCD